MNWIRGGVAVLEQYQIRPNQSDRVSCPGQHDPRAAYAQLADPRRARSRRAGARKRTRLGSIDEGRDRVGASVSRFSTEGVWLAKGRDVETEASGTSSSSGRERAMSPFAPVIEPPQRILRMTTLGRLDRWREREGARKRAFPSPPPASAKEMINLILWPADETNASAPAPATSRRAVASAMRRRGPASSSAGPQLKRTLWFVDRKVRTHSRAAGSIVVARRYSASMSLPTAWVYSPSASPLFACNSGSAIAAAMPAR